MQKHSAFIRDIFRRDWTTTTDACAIFGRDARNGIWKDKQGRVNDPGKVLQCQFSPLNVWAIAFGCIIVWGSFINPGKKFLPASGVAGAGAVLGRESLGWFVGMSAIGASIGFGFTCLATAKNLRKDHDGTGILYITSILGLAFSALFIFLQRVPIPGLSGVNFGIESYIMLLVWSGIGILFYVSKRYSFKE